MVRQPTMADIAQRAGVSRIAVSYALNGRPGVSAALREQILSIAREMGYRVNGAALALHGAAAQAFGLVMARSPAGMTVEVFRRRLIAGIQTELSGRGFGLALQFVRDTGDEMAVHRRWAAEQRVDGVLVIDPMVDDPRPAALRQMGLPYVVVGGTADSDGVWLDDAAAMFQVVDLLTGTGHRRIARISGPPGLLHTAIRDAAFQRMVATSTVLRGDYTGASGARLTRQLLTRGQPPTAIVYDNDVMAIAGLGAAQDVGVAVPADLSIVAWEDSALCRVVSPALTVVDHDIVAFGAQAARLLLARLDGPCAGTPGPGSTLRIRASTGPAR